jgi:riboflavin synthase
VFTGIVEELGRVVSCHSNRLRVEAATVLEGVHLGDSIAVNGACLTVVDSGAGWWEADVSDETLLRTNLGGLVSGDRVNLERPMRLEDRLGGHLVLGHVDGIGHIVSPAPDLVVRIDADLMRYCVEKGSITVDGVSLTAFDLGPDTFRVAVIPHTAAVTTLGYNGPGAKVNIEVDILAKHVERLLDPHLRDRA